MIEIRKIRGYKVRDLCLYNGWYTFADCDDYERMLVFCDACSNAQASDIQVLATDIKEHSNTPDSLEDVMCSLVNNCCFSYFI